MKTILIVKLGAMGDVIMSLPMIQSLSKQYPQAKIFWLSDKTYKPLFENFPNIQFLSCSHKILLFGSFFEKLKEMFSIYRKIAFKKFDLVILAHVDKRYKWLLFFTKYKNFHSFSQKQYALIPGRYHGYEYVRLCGENLKEVSLCWPNFYGKKKALDKSKIILAPGGDPSQEPGKHLRMWPIHFYKQLAGKLIHDGYKVGIIGANSDLWLEEHFKGLNVQSYIGKTSLKQVIELLSNSYALITHDSGPLHLGVLTNIKTIGLFGPTLAREKLPYRENVRYLQTAKLACMPCYNGKEYANCNNPICMKSISVEQVLKELYR